MGSSRTERADETGATRRTGAPGAGESGAGGPTGPGAGAPGSVAADSLTYEAARDGLAEIVRSLEAGGLPLEESLSLWERGERLAVECERWLAGARERLERATSAPAAGQDGTPDRP